MPKSSARAAKNPASLSQLSSIWYLTVREFATWIEMDDGELGHPIIILLVNEQQQVLHLEVLEKTPELDKLDKFLWHAMLHPPRELHLPPHRPQAIVCDIKDLADGLRPQMAEIQVEVKFVAVVELLDEIIDQLEDEYDEEDERPGLLSGQGNSPELAAALFAAAAEAYRQEPWIYLSTEQPVKFSIPALQKNGFVQLLGNSGIEYGLLLYWSWEEMERSYLNTGDPRPTLPKHGWISLSYVTADMIPDDDLEAIEKHAWPVAAPDAYPLPLVLFEDRIERPDQATLQVFYLLLHALPEFAQRLEPDFLGDYQPLTLEIAAPGKFSELTGDEAVWSVILQYPAGQLRREAFPAMIPLGEEEADLEAEPFDDFSFALPDAAGRSPTEEMSRPESETDDIGNYESLQDWENSPISVQNPALVKAMTLVYEAWDEEDPAERIQLARKALEISPDCAEAYLLLAEDLAVNVGQGLKFYQKGMEAGARALGISFFEQYSGEFWQHVEARPYLRARAGLARTLWELGRRVDALEHLHELLRLDTSDNLAAHFGILLIYFEMGRWDEAYQFSSGYQDTSEDWLYAMALLYFRQTGDSAEAQQKLESALLANPLIPDYLSGRKRLPADLPEANNPGQKSGAIHHAAVFLPFWRQTPGAIDWLRKHSRSSGTRDEQHRSRKNRPPKKRR